VIPTVGRVPLNRLEPRLVNRVLDAKLREGLSPRTVHHIRAVLRTALNAAIRYGHLSRNVASLAAPPRVPYQEPSTLGPDQARVLVESALVEPEGSIWLLALATGARQGELLGLRWSDFEPDRRELRIMRTLQRVAGTYQLAETKTARSRRTLRLPVVAVEALQRRRSQQAQERLLAGSGWQDRWDLIFTTTDGRPLDGTGVTKRFQRHLLGAGLPVVRFHDLRHSTASLLLAFGLQAREVQEQLGHHSVVTTLGIYGHVQATAQERMAAALDSILTSTR
jgi:integrase